MLKSRIAKYVASETTCVLANALKRIVDHQSDQDARQRDHERNHGEQPNLVGRAHHREHLDVDHRPEDQKGYDRAYRKRVAVSQGKKRVHVRADRDDERQSDHRQDREKGVAAQRGQHVTRHEDLRRPRDERAEAEHLEHQRDLVAKDHDALLPPIPPPIGSVMMVVIVIVVLMMLIVIVVLMMLIMVVVTMMMLMIVEFIGCPYLAQGVVKALADQLHLILIEGDEATDQVGDQQSASHPDPYDRWVETEGLGGRQERNGVDNRGREQKGRGLRDA